MFVKYDNSSAEDDYPLKRLLKKEIKEEPLTNNRTNSYSSSTSMVACDNITPPPPKLSRSNGRLRNIFIKKEESTNMWYSFPRNYDSDSSSNWIILMNWNEHRTIIFESTCGMSMCRVCEKLRFFSSLNSLLFIFLVCSIYIYISLKSIAVRFFRLALHIYNK